MVMFCDKTHKPFTVNTVYIPCLRDIIHTPSSVARDSVGLANDLLIGKLIKYEKKLNTEAFDVTLQPKLVLHYETKCFEQYRLIDNCVISCCDRINRHLFFINIFKIVFQVLLILK